MAEIVISAILVLIVLVNVSNQLNVISPLIYNVVHVTSLACIGALLIWFCFCKINEIALLGMLLVSGSLAVFLLNEIVFPSTADIAWSVYVRFALYCLPLVVVSSQIASPALLYSLLRSASFGVAMIAALFVAFKLFIPAFAQQASYYMGFGYAFLPFALIAFNDALRDDLSSREKVSALMAGLVISANIVLLGSRGPLGCIGFFFVLTVCRWLVRGKRLLLVAATFLVVAIVLFSSDLILGLVAKLLSMGGASRAAYLLEEFIQTGHVNLTGRTELQEPLLDEVIKNPLEIRGVAADRVVAGMYAHNLFLEVAFCFGLFFLVLVLFFAVGYLIRCLRNPDGRFGDMSTIFFSASVPCLMYSGSFWDSMLLWIGVTFTFYSAYSRCDIGACRTVAPIGRCRRRNLGDNECANEGPL